MNRNRSAGLELSLETQRRRQLMKAVVACVAEEGFEKTTMRKVAARAGVSTGMLAYYFRSKKELVNAAVLDANKGFGERLDANTSSTFGPRRIELLLEKYLRNDEPESPPRDFAIQVAAAAANDPELKKQHCEMTEDGRAKIERSIRAGIEAGQVRADVDPKMAADLIYGLMIGWSTEMAVCPDIVSPDYAVAVSKLALALLAGPKTRTLREREAGAAPSERLPRSFDQAGVVPTGRDSTPDQIEADLLADPQLPAETALALADAFRKLYAIAVNARLPPKNIDPRLPRRPLPREFR